MAMTLVSTVTVGSGGATAIEFTNIPQTGKDLLLVFSLRRTTNFEGEVIIRYNNITTSSYTHRALQGSGNSVASFTDTRNHWYTLFPGNDSTASTFGNAALYISNYTSTTAKSASIDSVTENNATTAYQNLFALSESSTQAVTSIKMEWSTMAQHSTASLYIIS